MKASLALALSTLAVQQVAATWNRHANFFNLPQYNNNECNTEQKLGFKWSGLVSGQTNFNYGGFSFGDGWTCADSFGKRDQLTKRTFGGKCIKNRCSKRKPAAFSCGSIKEGFSIKTIDVSVDHDVTLDFHYKMKNGSICKQTSNCSKSGTTVRNTQCGGAFSVEVYLGSSSLGRSSCEIGLHNIIFDCTPGQTYTPPPSYTPIIVSTRKPAPTPSPCGGYGQNECKVSKASSSIFTPPSAVPGCGGYGQPPCDIPSSVPGCGGYGQPPCDVPSSVFTPAPSSSIYTPPSAVPGCGGYGQPPCDVPSSIFTPAPSSSIFTPPEEVPPSSAVDTPPASSQATPAPPFSIVTPTPPAGPSSSSVFTPPVQSSGCGGYGQPPCVGSSVVISSTAFPSPPIPSSATPSPPSPPVESSATPLPPVESSATPLPPVESSATPLPPVQSSVIPSPPMKSSAIPSPPVESSALPSPPASSAVPSCVYGQPGCGGVSTLITIVSTSAVNTPPVSSQVPEASSAVYTPLPSQVPEASSVVYTPLPSQVPEASSAVYTLLPSQVPEASSAVYTPSPSTIEKVSSVVPVEPSATPGPPAQSSAVYVPGTNVPGVSSLVPSSAVGVSSVVVSVSPKPSPTGYVVPPGGYSPPSCLPSCLNTWLQLDTDCKDNTDSDCYCKVPDFTKHVMECLPAYGTLEEAQEALQYFVGICAKYVPQNPGIVTNCPENLPINPTPSPKPSGTPAASGTPPAASVTPPAASVTPPAPGYSAVSSLITPAVPEPSSLIPIPSPGYNMPYTTITFGSSSYTVPQVVFTTQTYNSPPSASQTSNPIALVPGNGPAQISASTTAAYPVNTGFSSITKPSGTSTQNPPVQFTGAATAVQMPVAGALVGAVLALFAL